MTSISGSSPTGALQQVLTLRQQALEQSEALKQIRGAGSTETTNAPTSAPAGTGFAETFETALSQVNAAQARASDISAAYERGEVTDIAQVMMARQESGVAFEATLQMRNKLLSAYQEIMRMGV